MVEEKWKPTLEYEIKFNEEVEDQIEIIKEMKHLIGQTTSLVENLRSCKG